MYPFIDHTQPLPLSTQPPNPLLSLSRRKLRESKKAPMQLTKRAHCTLAGVSRSKCGGDGKKKLLPAASWLLQRLYALERREDDRLPWLETASGTTCCCCCCCLQTGRRRACGGEEDGHTEVLMDRQAQADGLRVFAGRCRCVACVSLRLAFFRSRWPLFYSHAA